MRVPNIPRSVPVRGCEVAPLQPLFNAPFFLNSTIHDSFATLSSFRTTVSVTQSLDAANRKQNRPRGNSQPEATPVLVIRAQQTWSTMAPQRAARHVANDASNAMRIGQAVVNASGCDGCAEVTNQRKRQVGYGSRTRALVQGSFRRQHGPGAFACRQRPNGQGRLSYQQRLPLATNHPLSASSSPRSRA